MVLLILIQILVVVDVPGEEFLDAPLSEVLLDFGLINAFELLACLNDILLVLLLKPVTVSLSVTVTMISTVTIIVPRLSSPFV